MLKQVISLLTITLFYNAQPTVSQEYDIVVYGGTSAGVIAAVKAARMGRTTVLIEPGRHLGGLSSGGLGATDIGNKAAIGGMSREFYHRVWRHYQKNDSWFVENQEAFDGRGHVKGETTAWTFEPHVAEELFEQMLFEENVPVFFKERLNRESGVVKDGNRIREIRMESGKTFKGRMFIDATYEGDLLAAAGVSFTVGREPNSLYDETLNGVQIGHAVSHQFVKNVDPYIAPGDPPSGLLHGIQSDGPGEEFSGDRRVQAYCFRICATDAPEIKRAWPKPGNYDESMHELLLRNFEAGDHRLPWNPVMMPNRKTDSNNNFAVSTDYIGMNYDYPEADYATRDEIIAQHELYQKGLMWTLANHPRVPQSVRDHFSKWGLAKDEFLDNDNWPHQLYIREARRMIGDYVMKQANCLRQEVVEDSVGMGAYNMDSHNVQRYVTEEGFVRNEGDVQVRSYPYPISYRSIVPKQNECGNLFAPTCLSASHIAFGSIRMEPVFMVLGQSSATAAALALREGVDVQQLDYDTLRQSLIQDKQVLDLDVKVPASAVDPSSLKGIVIDDQEAQLSGPWDVSASIRPYVGIGYRHDRNAAKGEQSARYSFAVERAGKHEVRIAYSPHDNRASNVPVTIRHTGGETKRTVNQKTKPPIDGLWLSLGVFDFTPEQKGEVFVGNRDTDGYVVIDAVQVLRRED